MSSFTKAILYQIVVLIVLSSSNLWALSDQKTALKYDLAISFDINTKQLYGTAQITIAAKNNLILSLNGIEITGIIIDDHLSAPSTLILDNSPQINIEASNSERDLYISYKKYVTGDHDNFIEENGITLLSNWFPQPTQNVLFSLKASVPEGFSAISESDHLTDPTNNIYSFSFSQPVTAIHFTAAPFVRATEVIHPRLKIFTYFHEENKKLSEKYLKAAAEYLEHYEKHIGPFPYNHFAIVENVRQTGVTVPTLTLLGGKVLRLPFIISTSLGHEIVHSWFGSSVQVAENSGNWSEGLSSYLADWSYREQLGQGAEGRKEELIKYSSYVHDYNSISLQSFHLTSHSQPLARTSRAVGYIKGAMLFHELKNRIGGDAFDRAVGLLYQNFKFKKAGWLDIQSLFEQTSQQDLDSFFNQRLNSTDIPALQVDEIHSDYSTGDILLKFSLTQNTEETYDLIVPIRVETTLGQEWFYEEVKSKQHEIRLNLKATPVSFTIDPQYDLLRKLDESEKVATWSKVLGASEKTIIVAQQDRDKFAPLLHYFSKDMSKVVDPEKITNSELSGNNLVFLGSDNRSSRSFFASPDQTQQGLSIDIRTHPLNSTLFAARINCSEQNELTQTINRLPHYGKYSFLHFQNGVLKVSKTGKAAMGRKYNVESQPTFVASAAAQPLTDLTVKLAEAKVIYIGETHTSMADHRLQFRLIEKLFHQNPEIAIGLEMFPRNSQNVLNEYIFGDNTIDEREFLKRSNYFKVWKYDYRYYRDIINFAKKHRIPLVGLNIDKEVVSSIFKHGSTDALSDDQLALLPVDRDLALPGYYQRLKTMYGFHHQGSHSTGNLGGFIQAQSVWDEIMAENAVNYLRKNHNKQMVILAGSQHTRKDSGIPPRVFRRKSIKQVSILRANGFEPLSEEITDYYIHSADQILPPAGKIGIMIEEKDRDGLPYLLISRLTQQSNAKKSGLLVGDTLLSIGGYTVTQMQDIRIAMIDARPGDTLIIEVDRDSMLATSRKMSFTVELSEPAAEGKMP